MSLLTDFRLSVLEQHLGVYGIHVYQKGKTIAEHRFRSDDRVNMYSAAKTFTAIGIGIAEHEGLLSMNDSVLSFFPEYHAIASEGSDAIKVEHLLRMTTGHLFEDFSEYNVKDRAEIFFTTKLKEEPGQSFYYENLCTYMLGRIVEKLSGENMLNYLKPRLFSKLNIINPQWHTCPFGHTECAGGLYLTTEELSRIGVVLLNNGMYNGTFIVPKNYVERMKSNWIDTSYKLDPESKEGYGYQVWKCTLPNTYRADGMYGQTCIVLDDYNAVITYTGHYEAYEKDTLRAVWHDIVPLLEKNG